MGVEILDRLDVLRGERHQVARTPIVQIGGGELLQLAVEGHPHLGQQLVGHVMRQPGFQPVQHTGDGRHQQQRDRHAGESLPGSHRGQQQRPQHADADERGDPADAE